MTSDAEMGRRVSRLENDTESIYELLTELRSAQDEHARRFDRIDDTLTEHARRFDRIDSTLTEHARRFDRIDSTLDEVVRRLPEPT